jgi:GTPase SAR1 family protein
MHQTQKSRNVKEACEPSIDEVGSTHFTHNSSIKDAKPCNETHPSFSQIMANSSHDGAFGAGVVHDLQQSQNLELLDAVDQLRAEGLNEHVDLSQLIVVGDQSSGKSSLLSAISGVPFPRKDNLCTRFATEVVLRRNDSLADVQITVTIISSSSRPYADRTRLDAFARKLQTIDGLPNVMEAAATAMRLGPSDTAFAADILRLDVCGARMPQLTIVDLPGLVHAETNRQTKEDIALVNGLVDEYMAQERSIILAVVSAKNDYQNQIVLTKTRQVDPDGRRTLGIVTKPDTLFPNSGSETSFLELIRNEDIKFSLGWHVVRNPDSNENQTVDPGTLEHDFFRKSRMSRIDPSKRGLSSLRTRLSEVLFRQIERELPSLMKEVFAAASRTRDGLERMGRSRTTIMEKRHFVMDIGTKFHSLCFAACEGLYEDQVFAEHGSDMSARRLRAVIQNTNIEFVARMLKAPLRTGHLGASETSESDAFNVVDRARELVHSYRGKELPGTFNPALIGQLFRELSRPWRLMAREHIDAIWLAARVTAVAVIDSITNSRVRDACLRTVIDPALESMRRTMVDRFDDYMANFERQSITYNHYLTENVQRVRLERDRAAAKARFIKFHKERERKGLGAAEYDDLVSCAVPETQPDMDALAAQNLADYAQAYYQVRYPCFVKFADV